MGVRFLALFQAAQPLEQAVDTGGLGHAQHVGKNHIVDFISLYELLNIHCIVMAEIQCVDLVIILRQERHQRIAKGIFDYHAVLSVGNIVVGDFCQSVVTIEEYILYRSISPRIVTASGQSCRASFIGMALCTPNLLAS